MSCAPVNIFFLHSCVLLCITHSYTHTRLLQRSLGLNGDGVHKRLRDPKLAYVPHILLCCRLIAASLQCRATHPMLVPMPGAVAQHLHVVTCRTTRTCFVRYHALSLSCGNCHAQSLRLMSVQQRLHAKTVFCPSVNLRGCSVVGMGPFFWLLVL